MKVHSIVVWLCFVVAPSVHAQDQRYATNNSFFRVEKLSANSWLTDFQVKFAHISCGSPQLHLVKNQLVPVNRNDICIVYPR